MIKLPKVVVLTGAGISAESGIATFRAEDGLWENHPVDDVATPEGFIRDRQGVLNFYNTLRNNLAKPEIKPNAAHIALAELETLLGDNFLLVTQNIDNLHERAGSQRVLHMHGELLKVRCEVSGEIFDRDENVTLTSVCSCCNKQNTLRPHIVWFGEMPLYMDQIEKALAQCDLFISIGTSGHVYPAAGFVQSARYFGANTVELNLEPSLVKTDFKEAYYGKATQVVPAFITAWRKEQNI